MPFICSFLVFHLHEDTYFEIHDVIHIFIYSGPTLHKVISLDASENNVSLCKLARYLGVDVERHVHTW